MPELWNKIVERNIAIQKTTKGLGRELRKLSDLIEADLESVVHQIAVILWRSIIQKTPVDTGRARANWQLETRPDNSKIGKKKKSTNKNIKKTIPPPYGLPLDPKIPGNLEGLTVYIFNNLDYIEELELGSSDQAPEGMILRSLQEIKKGVRKILRKHNLT